MDIERILSAMTLEEKAALCQGADFWHTTACERLGVPSVMVSDGPHGLRKQDQRVDHLGVNDSIKAVCFPTAVGTAASFDVGLMDELGQLIGQEAQAEDLAVVLGPAANIKRSPLCGRNFEYISEDPYLSGEMAAAYIRGVQQQGVGTSLKHFAMNNQETRRMSVSAQVSERAMREIYLASFEGAVKGGRPWTVMCSYNKVNGTYSSENPWLMQQVLRDEWGFDGLVMTDWGACNDHCLGVASGLDLEMPRGNDAEDAELVRAVREGRVSMEALDAAARNVLQLVARYQQAHREGEEFDRGFHHHQARKLAREAMVLLKNDGALLPIRGNKKVAFIGAFAEKPRFQGGGSSHINCSEETSALDAVRSVGAVRYAQGFRTENNEVDDALEAEALAAARDAEIAVLFLGLPDRIESEGYDRRDMRLPDNQNHLVQQVLQVQPNVAVVLHCGAPVELPWADAVPSILCAYLGGQASGGAVVDLLYGAVSPCGKLAETWPLRLEDNPSYLNFPGSNDQVCYAEDIWVGYRYYDKKQMAVRFPFGHGLSYSSFAYSNLRLSSDRFTDGEITVQVDVTNTGSMAAKEAVQLYIRPLDAAVPRPLRELKGFAKLALQPGETGTVSFTLNCRSFAYWETSIHDWFAAPGRYAVEAAASSRDIRLCAELQLDTPALPVVLTADSTVGDAGRIPGALDLLWQLQRGKDAGKSMEGETDAASEAISPEMIQAMMNEMPIHALSSFAGISREKLLRLVDQMNQLADSRR